MDNLTEQIQLIVNGISWQLLLVMLAAAALTEQAKKIPGIRIRSEACPTCGKADGAPQSHLQEWGEWFIHGFLPETICILACVFIPNVLPEDTVWGLAAVIGYLSGTLSSNLYNLFLKALLDRVTVAFGVLSGRSIPAQPQPPVDPPQ